jgi:hypothetical protein
MVARTTMAAPMHNDNDGTSPKKTQPAKPEKIIERYPMGARSRASCFW